jgi:hypothetical protein
MWNCYKREDVFVCRSECHQRFEHRVSAHHVLVEKRCFPQGCVSFAWKCKRLHKGRGCPRGYRHVGSNCTQCRFYDEEKIQRRPSVLLDERAFAEFLEACRDFDAWLDQVRDRPLCLGGRVTDVRPHLVRRVDGRRSRLSLCGHLVRLQPGYIELRGLDDPLYLEISRAQQQRHRVAPGDGVEAEAWVRLSRGRLVGVRPKRLQVEERGGEAPPEWEQALLDRLTAVALPDQPERCLRCSRGVLADVEEIAPSPGRTRPAPRRRELLCLEGLGRPEDCPFEALRSLRRQPLEQACVGSREAPEPDSAHSEDCRRRIVP